jgi:hypothetical protein
VGRVRVCSKYPRVTPADHYLRVSKNTHLKFWDIHENLLLLGNISLVSPGDHCHLIVFEHLYCEPGCISALIDMMGESVVVAWNPCSARMLEMLTENSDLILTTRTIYT